MDADRNGIPCRSPCTPPPTWPRAGVARPRPTHHPRPVLQGHRLGRLLVRRGGGVLGTTRACPIGWMPTGTASPRRRCTRPRWSRRSGADPRRPPSGSDKRGWPSRAWPRGYRRADRHPEVPRPVTWQQQDPKRAERWLSAGLIVTFVVILGGLAYVISNRSAPGEDAGKVTETTKVQATSHRTTVVHRVAEDDHARTDHHGRHDDHVAADDDHTAHHDHHDPRRHRRHHPAARPVRSGRNPVACSAGTSRRGAMTSVRRWPTGSPTDGPPAWTPTATASRARPSIRPPPSRPRSPGDK